MDMCLFINLFTAIRRSDEEAKWIPKMSGIVQADEDQVRGELP